MSYGAWTAIERAARRQIEETEAEPLAFGDRVAWSSCSYGKTDALSGIHRVSDPDPEHCHTFCGETIPAPVRLVQPLKSLDVCRTCEVQFAESLIGLTVSA